MKPFELNSGTGYSIPLFSSVALRIEPTELGIE